MSEGVMAVVKPEMKSYIWLQTTDGSIQQVEEEVAMFCPMICREILQTGMGSSKNYAISLPQRVNPAILGLILDYCRFHQVPGHSNKERKTFNEKFVRMDTKRLCELTSAADSLQLKPLVDLTSRALARIIEGKTPEEIRETFHLPDDLTEIWSSQEEKLEPLRNITDDPRIRLLNRLYARKRKELKEREKLKNVEVEEERVDERSVDDLLSFINGGDQDSKGVRTTKNKKKNRRRKEQLKHSSDSVDVNYNKELDAAPAACNQGNIDNILVPTRSKTSKLQDSSAVIFSPKMEFDDADIDDDIDPAMKEELDREVEDFARRLNSDWPERMQEILSLGHERRLVPMSINGEGPMSRFSIGVGFGQEILNRGKLSVFQNGQLLKWSKDDPSNQFAAAPLWRFNAVMCSVMKQFRN
ncbi:SKP1 component [Theobroma cacao]|nr:SKP1 component [Theobroma cacao]